MTTQGRFYEVFESWIITAGFPWSHLLFVQGEYPYHWMDPEMDNPYLTLEYVLMCSNVLEHNP
jgi:hypothetical protein